MAQRLTTSIPTSIHEIQTLGLLNGLRIWCCHEVWCRSQKWIRSRVVAVGGVGWQLQFRFYSTFSQGISICHGCDPKKTKDKKKKKKPCKLNGLDNRSVLSHSSKNFKSKFKVLVGLISSAVFLLGFQMLLFCCLFTWSSLCVCISIVLCVSSFLFLKGHQSDWIRVHSTHFNLIMSLKPSLKKQSDSEILGLRASTYKFGASTF